MPKFFRHLLFVLVAICFSPLTQARIKSSTSSISFGPTAVNTISAPRPITITNSGWRTLTITQASSSLTEFSVSGHTLPLVLPPGNNFTFQVTFHPDAVRTFSGSLTFSGSVDNGGGRFLSILVAGTGTSANKIAPAITKQPTSITVASGQKATFIAGASGTQPLIYQWQRNNVNITGATTSSYTTPILTSADNGATFRIIVSNTVGSATSAAVRLTVTTAPAPGIRVSTSVLNFGSTLVGASASQALGITNTGAAPLHISKITAAGVAFVLTPVSLPATVAIGQQFSLTITFHPTAAGPASGSISIMSDASGTPTIVNLAGTGTTPTSSLSVTPPKLSFGDIETGTTSASQSVTIANSGGSSVTISKISASGSGFSIVSGGGTPVTLSPAQSIIVLAAFTPASNGSATGSISITSDATTPSSSVTLTGAGTATARPAWVWGVTTDDPTVNTSQQVAALSSFSKRVMVRTVFDPPAGGHPTAADYVPSITSISSAADVMGLLVDSSEMANMSLTTVRSRVAEYLDAMGERVTVWEIGNEVNGNWLGSGVMPKIEAMYDAVKAAGRQTALTVYYENPATPGFDMIPWIDANIPPGHRMRTGLDYVLVSYYEDENSGHQLTQTELNTIFSALASRFPSAKVGFGEYGWGQKIPPAGIGDATRAALLQRFSNYRVPSVPAYIGGGFYWHFRQTMIPKTSPDWTVFDTLMDNFSLPPSSASLLLKQPLSQKRERRKNYFERWRDVPVRIPDAGDLQDVGDAVTMRR